MRRIVLLAIAVLFCLWPAVSEAFLCWGKDFGCLARYILPNNQTDTNPKREWSANAGHVIGKDGNIIEFKLRFDSQSFETLRYNFQWYSAANALLEIKRFGLEIDICDPSNTLRFDYVKSDFPNAAKATTDTDLSDSINSCKNAMGLLVKNPAALEEGKDYYVHFYLKDPIPSEGIVVTPSLQISADTRLLQNASPFYGGAALFNELFLGGYRSKFEYFAVETDGYIKGDGDRPWRIYPDGSGGLCWNSKEWSEPCSNSISEVLSGMNIVERELLPRYFGVTTLPYGDFQEVQELYPDFITQKVTLSTPWNQEVYAYGYNETIKIDSYIKNIGEANWAGDREDMYVKAYLSNGYKEDSHSEWINVGTDQIQKGNIDVGTTKHEAFTINLATINNGGPLAPGIYNFVVCADRKYDQDNGDGEVPEMHKSNNCSTEAVFEIKDVPQINFPYVDFTISSLSLQKTPLPVPAGGLYSAKMAIRNIGNMTSPNGIRSQYAIKGPGTNGQWRQIADDGSDAGELTPNRDQWEDIGAAVQAPSVPGTYTLRGCADYQNNVTESDETNNCAYYNFQVYANPSIVVTNPTSGDNWRSDKTKHITWQANYFPVLGDVRIEYSMDGGASWRTIDSSTANDGSRYWDMCKSTTKDSSNSYIRIRSLNYPNSFGVSQRFTIDHAKKCK